MYLKYFIALLVVSNPIGSLAIYLGLTSGESKEAMNRIPYVTAISVFIILGLSLWVGWPLLNFFGITIESFKIAGGLVVFGIGMSMIKGTSIVATHKKESASVGVVPLAMPIIAGPGAITVAISYSHDFSSMVQRTYATGICCALAVVFLLVLKLAPWVKRRIGDNGIDIACKVMGLLVAAIAVQMISNGVKLFLASQ